MLGGWRRQEECLPTPYQLGAGEGPTADGRRRTVAEWFFSPLPPPPPPPTEDVGYEMRSAGAERKEGKNS